MPNQYPKVGIGIITCQNRKIKDNFLNLISGPTSIYIYTDHDRRGVPYARNECLKALFERDGCDYVFLFDDDTYPIDPDWQAKLVDLHESTGLGLFSYPSRESTAVSSGSAVTFFQWNFGPFMSITREMFEAIGYFNSAYTKYGFEDIAYICRARKSGLNGPENGDPTPTAIYGLVLAEDVLGTSPPPLNTSEEAKRQGITTNRPIFEREVNGSKIYYAYKEKEQID